MPVKSPKTFNVFLCGTTAKSSYHGQEGIDRGYHEGELVAWLATLVQKTGQKEFIDYVIYNGVGSGNLDNHKHPISRPIFEDYQAIPTGRGSDAIRDAAATLIQGKVEPSRLIGMVNGKKTAVRNQPVVDIDELNPDAYESQYAKEIIAAWEKQEITEVNIVGWSRGGFNAIRLAHKLHEFNQKNKKENPSKKPIEVNILTFDPVPGPGNRSKESDTIPPNVKNYVSYLSLHEHTWGFDPVIPVLSDPNQDTKVTIETFPATHSSVVGGLPKQGLTAEQQKPLTDLARLSALEIMVNKFGMKELSKVLSNYQKKGSEEARWNEIHQNREVYTQLQGTTITGVKGSYKPYQLGKGKVVFHRQVTHGPQSVFLDEVLGCQHNSPDPLDEKLGIHSDTCTLHRKYNDRVLAGKISAYLAMHFPPDAINSYYVELLTELRAYIEKRHLLAGDNVLADALQAVTLRTVDMIAAYIKHTQMDISNNQDESFELTFTKLDSDYLFLAAQTGSVDYLVIVGSRASDDDEIKALFDVKNKDGMTPLMIAAQHGHIEAVTLLQQLSATVTLKNNLGRDKTALDYAAEQGHVEIVKSLLNAYPSNLKRAAQFQAMILAAKQDKPEIVNLWINDLTEQDLKELSSIEIANLLIWAIQNKSTQTIHLLTQDIDKIFQDPMTRFVPKFNDLIIWAARNNRSDIIDQALVRWPKFFTSPSIIEHPEISTLLIWAIDNKKRAVTLSLITTAPQLIQLRLNDQDETALNRLAQKDFQTFKIALHIRRMQATVQESEIVVRQIKALPNHMQTITPSKVKAKLAPQIAPTLNPPRKIKNLRMKKYAAALVIAASSTYLGMAVASSIPTLAALLPGVLAGLVVSSFTFGIPAIVSVVLAVAIATYVHYQPVKERSRIVSSIGKFLKDGVEEFAGIIPFSSGTKARFTPRHDAAMTKKDKEASHEASNRQEGQKPPR